MRVAGGEGELPGAPGQGERALCAPSVPPSCGRAAEELLGRTDVEVEVEVEVTMLERLPVPWGDPAPTCLCTRCEDPVGLPPTALDGGPVPELLARGVVLRSSVTESVPASQVAFASGPSSDGVT